jgi:hypothetical protein
MVGMKISQVDWSKGLGGKGEDRRTFIIRSVINNNDFTTDPIHFRGKGISTLPNVSGMILGDSDG